MKGRPAGKWDGDNADGFHDLLRMPTNLAGVLLNRDAGCLSDAG